MVDADTIKVMVIFEACASLGQGAELAGLSAHIYHRFLMKSSDHSKYDLYTLAGACIKLGHWFYETRLDNKELVMVLLALAHGPRAQVDDQIRKKISKSIDIMVYVVAINLNFEVNYKDTRRITPGHLKNSYAAARQRMVTSKAIINDDESSSSISDASDFEDPSDFLLTKNDKTIISSHRYLAHYLKSLHSVIEQSQDGFFCKLANVAWTLLSDVHYSPFVIHHRSPHLACACLTMAIQCCREFLNVVDEPPKKRLWQLLDKKWNLILCNDLTNKQLDIIIESIVRQYNEYNRMFERELVLSSSMSR